MASYDKARKAYAFFADAERTGKAFTLEDIAAASGWGPGTVRTYRSKKWYFFIKEDKGGLRVEGLSPITEETFLRLSGQKLHPGGDILRPRFGPTVDSLIDKSRESALLAVQVYNNPLVSFRTPGYIVHMMIAFTALFHAIFEKQSKDYTFKKADGSPEIVDGDTKAWDLSKCVKEYYAGRTVPEGENLTFFVQLRNKIEHRFLPGFDVTVSGKSQALLMNYEALLVKEFGSYFALNSHLGLALQFSRYSDRQREAITQVQSKEFDALRKFVQEFDDQRSSDITESPQYAFRAYLIPKTGNHAKSSDIAIEWVAYDPNDPEEIEKYNKVIGLIRERRVPVAYAGELKPTDVCGRVAAKTGKKFGLHQHTNAWKLYKVRPKSSGATGCKSEYCQYVEPFNQYLYTEKWVEFLCARVNDPVEYEKICKYRGSSA